MEYIRKFGVIPVCLVIFAMSAYIASHDMSHFAFTAKQCFCVMSAPIVVLVYLIVGESNLFTPSNLLLMLGAQWIVIGWFFVKLKPGKVRIILFGFLLLLMLFGVFIMINPYLWRMAI